jgi:hypothetical protein
MMEMGPRRGDDGDSVEEMMEMGVQEEETRRRDDRDGFENRK